MTDRASRNDEHARQQRDRTGNRHALGRSGDSMLWGCRPGQRNRERRTLDSAAVRASTTLSGSGRTPSRDYLCVFINPAITSAFPCTCSLGPVAITRFEVVSLGLSSSTRTLYSGLMKIGCWIPLDELQSA
jgi:hypothetical protein